MAFTRFDKDVEIISKLSDDPNITDSLSSNQLKAKFDQGSKTIKGWINDTLFVALEALSAAANIGAKLTGFAAVTTVQGALDQLKTLIDQISRESGIADGAVTTDKLASEDLTGNPPVLAAVSTEKIRDGAVTHAKLATVDANGANGAVGTDNINDGAITSAKLAENIFSGSTLTDNSVTAAKLASVDGNGANGAVSADKINNGAVSTVLTGTLTSSGWTGSAAPYLQTVSVTGILSTDNPIVDAVYSGTHIDDINIADAFANIYRIVTENGSITAYSTGKPSEDLPIRLLCIRK